MTRPRIVAVALALVLLAAGYAGGRYSRPAPPARLEAREDVKAKAQTAEATTAKAASQQAAAIDTKRNMEIKRVWRACPPGGGGTEVTETTRDLSTAEERYAAATQAEGTSTKATATQLDRSTVTITTAQAQWGVSVQPGVDLRSAVTGDGLAPQLGAIVERRLFGGVWGGAWGNTTGAAGLSVRMEF